MPVRDPDMWFALTHALLVVRHQVSGSICGPDCPVMRQSVLFQFHDCDEPTFFINNLGGSPDPDGSKNLVKRVGWGYVATSRA